MDRGRKVEILEALKKESLFGLVSVEPGKGDGVIVYSWGANRVGGEPAIEIPHESPYLVDESKDFADVSPPGKTFEELLSEYGCLAKTVDGFTYVVVDENVATKRPSRGEA